MNFKKIGLLLCFSLSVLCVVFYFLFQKESFQEKPTGYGMEQLGKFCDQHLGKDWGVDRIFGYNDKILFADVHTQGAVVSMSIHPENRVILIENIQGSAPVPLKKLIYRF